MTDLPDLSLAERVARLGGKGRRDLLGDFDSAQALYLLHDWRFWARPKQLPPAGDWFCWLVIAGRGFGKTRMGVEWVRMLVEGDSPLSASGEIARIALVADTFADARDIMVEGESGILSCSPPYQRPNFEVSKRRLTWPNGTIATLYSAEDPDQLRGPQHHLAWGDEVAKWSRLEESWSNLLLGLRLGANPRVLATTTPRPLPMLRQLMDAEDTVVTRGGTFENQVHLSPAFLAHVRDRYANTRIGRQEIDGEILEDIQGALWTHKLIDANRRTQAAIMGRIVVAVDPPVTSGKRSDACGIVVAGLGVDGEFYVLADRSVQGVSPESWARTAIAAADEFHADRLIAEVNNGGDLVESVLRTIDTQIPYKKVRASRGKIARAEPVAALYEQGRVHHLAVFPELEDELCAYDGGPGQNSPDRMDALVWALTELAFAQSTNPKIRRI
ncbi:MAG: terminase family protein [Sphingomonadales bacterium]|jgi:phage terminase large subunit-like protein